jgi:hypothetical protein
VPHGAWLIGTGLLLLGLNLARYLNGITMRGWTTLLCGLALAAGLASLLGVKLPLLALLLVVLGAAIILRPLVARRS